MHAFSSTLAELYERAAHVGPREFPMESVQLIRRLIDFDGAMLGIGNVNRTVAKNLLIDRAAVACPTESFQCDYADVPMGAPLTPDFFKNLDTPVACDLQHLHEKRTSTQWFDFAYRHNIRKVLVYGDLPTDGTNTRWIILYRIADHDFHEGDKRLLHALWQHLRQATVFNLGRALNRSDPLRTTRAMALVNSCGLIEVADTEIIDLLKLEWSDFNERCLPAAVVSSLVESGTYHGKRVDLTGFQKFGYMVCTAKRSPLIKSLAPSEMNVARRFAHGMTHKEIAAHLNVSPHTVRNQLAQVYQKLGVHGKAELTRMIVNS